MTHIKDAMFVKVFDFIFSAKKKKIPYDWCKFILRTERFFGQVRNIHTHNHTPDWDLDQ